MNALKKIVVIGGESTGKSTLCEQLAARFNTGWVPEYARAYLENLGREHAKEDLLVIAKGQLEQEDKLAVNAEQWLFCDTDLQVIQVWSEFKYQYCDPFISQEIKQRKYHAYILTSPDFPWEADPLREHPEPALRTYFFELYQQKITERGLPFCIVSGNKKTRLEQAVQFIQTLTH